MAIIKLQGDAELLQQIYYEVDSTMEPIVEDCDGRMFKGAMVGERTRVKRPAAIKLMHDDLPACMYERGVSSSDRTIRVWDVNSGLSLVILKGHKDVVRSASFSSDGTHIMSASDDKTIIIWDFPSIQELIDETRKRFKNRPLTTEELQKYYLE